MTSRRTVVNLTVWAIYAAGILALASWLSLASGRNSPWIVACVTIVGLAYGFVLFRLKLPGCAASFFLLVAAAIFIALIRFSDTIGTVYFSWLGGFLAGTVLGAWPRLDSKFSQRKSRTARTWQINGDIANTTMSASKMARRCLMKLDGIHKYRATIITGHARMDIIGNPNTGFAAYCSRESGSEISWSLLKDSSKNDAVTTIDTGAGKVTLAGDNVVTIETALRALDGFLRHRGPDPALNWLRGDQAYRRRPSWLE